MRSDRFGAKGAGKLDLARRLLFRPVAFWHGQFVAVGCVATASLVRFGLTPLLKGEVPFVTFFPAVVIASVLGGIRAGISSLVLATVIAICFWAPPQWDDSGSSWWLARLLVFWVCCGLLITIAALLRALLETLSESERRARVFAQEMQHRVKNLLGMALAISYQAARNAHTAAEHHAILETRLAALGRAQETILGDLDSSPDLGALIHSVVAPFGPSHFDIAGPAIAVPADLCLGLALLVHELGTNATKHGALSVSSGQVAVHWAPESNRVRLVWKERGGPPVKTPTRSGFGSKLMRSVLPADRGEIAVSFEPAGLMCEVRIRVGRQA